MTSLPPRHLRSELLALGGLILVQVALSAGIRKSGFLAISDDDYARVVIAQNFVQTPNWDPSGTSWLPFPFLHLGAAMMFFSPSLEFARVWTLVCSCAATLLLFAAGRQWQVRVSLAFAAAAAGALLPYATYLAAATVPEYLTAALLIFALATLEAKTSDTRAHWLGAACMCLATASRYEAWPVALAFAGIKVRDAIQLRSLRPLVSSTLALGFPLVWMAHGLKDHGNALFFVTRVADYKEALEAGSSGAVIALRYLEALFLAEPEAILAALGLAGVVAAKGSGKKVLARTVRAWLPLGFMLLVLLVSALRSGVATHHEERVLLPIWLLSVLTCAVLIEHGRPTFIHAAIPLFFGIGLGFGLRHSEIYKREDFTDRRQEEVLGRHLRVRFRAETRIGLSLEDYGYFAVLAAAENPQRFEILDTHDPRVPTSAPELLTRYREAGGCLFVAPSKQPVTLGTREVEMISRWSVRQFDSCTF